MTCTAPYTLADVVGLEVAEERGEQVGPLLGIVGVHHHLHALQSWLRTWSGDWMSASSTFSFTVALSSS